MPDRWARIDSLFHDALEVAPADRAAATAASTRRMHSSCTNVVMSCASSRVHTAVSRRLSGSYTGSLSVLRMNVSKPPLYAGDITFFISTPSPGTITVISGMDRMMPKSSSGRCVAPSWAADVPALWPTIFTGRSEYATETRTWSKPRPVRRLAYAFANGILPPSESPAAVPTMSHSAMPRLKKRSGY